MRKEIAQFLQTGQEAIARIRVEHVIREQNICAAYEILELFCEFVLARVPILESQRNCLSLLPQLSCSTSWHRYKLRNIEETEAAKKLLQDKRLVGRSKAELSIPSSYSADYFQRGRDYAEKLRREHPELYKDRAVQENGAGPRQADTANTKAAGRRQAATDEFMLERFRKRERHRGMRR
ncbi:hypothetical protein HHK36_032016 [Tetracentron sinense]|uniref:Uncharacterized protein n=1 Tax=Tetracentron sinense TaxID=13715 RepID=A0A834Y8T8_TETSI|nr:hypothetical protein HHK36_032016 [Tetracentron sinense]